MWTAIIGGLIIGLLVKGWFGIFILPVSVALYQCVALFFLIKQKRISLSQTKGFTNPYAEIHYKLYASSRTKWADSLKIYVIQFFWTYTSTTLVAFGIALIMKFAVAFSLALVQPVAAIIPVTVNV